MHLHVTNNDQIQSTRGDCRIFNTRGGIRKSTIEKCDLSTRLFHDLGIYGEAAEDYVKVLEDVYDEI